MGVPLYISLCLVNLYAAPVRLIRRLLVAAGLGWVVWRLFGPEVEPTYQGKQERPLSVPGRTVLVGEQEFFVREAGSESAPPLVLIHGLSLIHI